ncbi:MAG: PIN domain-containing protein, partial [Candidatus Dormibacteria bacterium]
MNVFDASALLAFLEGEEGADLVESALGAGGACAAANWSEVNQKILAHARSWELARSLLTSHDLAIEPVTQADAESAAQRRVSGEAVPKKITTRGHSYLAADTSWSCPVRHGFPPSRRPCRRPRISLPV